MWRWLLLAGLLLNGLCCSVGLAADDAGDSAGAHLGKKILWVDSYHAEYEWSAGLERGLLDALEGSGVELKIVHMDTKRHYGEGFYRQAALKAKKIIEAFQPDLVIASDDNAQRYLVVPYLRETKLPVVFCGLNADPADYGYPRSNVTGMIEDDKAEGLIMHLRRFAGGRRAGILGGDAPTMRIAAGNYNRQFFNGRLQYYLVRNFAEFKAAFLRAQQDVDMLLVHNNAGIADWDAAEAEAFVVANVRIPTGSALPWMKSYNLFTIAKVPEEQGEYSGAVALRILGGEKPADLPVVSNRLAHLVVNLKIAKATGIVLPVSVLQTAEVIGQEALRD